MARRTDRNFEKAYVCHRRCGYTSSWKIGGVSKLYQSSFRVTTAASIIMACIDNGYFTISERRFQVYVRIYCSIGSMTMKDPVKDFIKMNLRVYVPDREYRMFSCGSG